MAATTIARMILFHQTSNELLYQAVDPYRFEFTGVFRFGCKKNSLPVTISQNELEWTSRHRKHFSAAGWLITPG